MSACPAIGEPTLSSFAAAPLPNVLQGPVGPLEAFAVSDSGQAGVAYSPAQDALCQPTAALPSLVVARLDTKNRLSAVQRAQEPMNASCATAGAQVSLAFSGDQATLGQTYATRASGSDRADDPTCCSQVALDAFTLGGRLRPLVAAATRTIPPSGAIALVSDSTGVIAGWRRADGRPVIQAPGSSAVTAPMSTPLGAPTTLGRAAGGAIVADWLSDSSAISAASLRSDGTYGPIVGTTLSGVSDAATQCPRILTDGTGDQLFVCQSGSQGALTIAIRSATAGFVHIRTLAASTDPPCARLCPREHPLLDASLSLTGQLAITWVSAGAVYVDRGSITAGAGAPQIVGRPGVGALNEDYPVVAAFDSGAAAVAWDEVVSRHADGNVLTAIAFATAGPQTSASWTTRDVSDPHGNCQLAQVSGYGPPLTTSRNGHGLLLWSCGVAHHASRPPVEWLAHFAVG